MRLRGRPCQGSARFFTAFYEEASHLFDLAASVGEPEGGGRGARDDDEVDPRRNEPRRRPGAKKLTKHALYAVSLRRVADLFPDREPNPRRQCVAVGLRPWRDEHHVGRRRDAERGTLNAQKVDSPHETALFPE